MEALISLMKLFVGVSGGLVSLFLIFAMYEAAVSSSDDEEDDYETYRQTETEVMKEIISEKVVEVSFVRGETDVIRYREFDGVLGDSSSKEIEEGKYLTERNGVAVEQFCEIDRVTFYSTIQDSTNRVKFHGSRRGDEITTANVISRRVISEQEVEVHIPVELDVKYRKDTDEEVYPHFPSQIGELEFQKKS